MNDHTQLVISCLNKAELVLAGQVDNSLFKAVAGFQAVEKKALAGYKRNYGC